MRQKRTEQQMKWADHGYELTQQFTIKAAQNNMRSLKAQNAGIVSGIHAKKADRIALVESQRAAAAEERRQRVNRVREETTDTVTRNAKKSYVDERVRPRARKPRTRHPGRRHRPARPRRRSTLSDARVLARVLSRAWRPRAGSQWDIADSMREKAEAYRAQRKAQELAYLEQALAINAATSMEPAKASRAKAKEQRQKGARRAARAALPSPFPSPSASASTQASWHWATPWTFA